MPNARKYSSHVIVAFPVLLLVLNFFGVLNGWYLTQNGFDKVLHFFGGFWAAALFLWFFYQKPFQTYASFFKSALLTVILVVAFASLLGLLWEFFEFSYDHFVAIPYHVQIAQLSNDDTMGDLIADFFGGVVFSVFFIRFRRLLP